jgi:hypothetical protein
MSVIPSGRPDHLDYERALREAAGNNCFYCAERLTEAVVIWRGYRDDASCVTIGLHPELSCHLAKDGINGSLAAFQSAGLAAVHKLVGGGDHVSPLI